MSVLLNYQPYGSNANGNPVSISGLGSNIVGNRAYKIMFYAV
jgi:hypothetical protein